MNMFFGLLVFLAITVSLPISTAPFDFKIVTFNVRQDTDNRFLSEQAWSDRKVGVVDLLQREAKSLPTLIGLQELKHNQLTDVLAGLNTDGVSDWDYFGVGRDDGKTSGEYSAIIYRSDEWKLIDGTTKWLSKTPDKPSISWGSANIRTVTFSTFKNVRSGESINYFNTHFDHKSEEARQKSAELILNFIDEEPNDYPTFLSGDFNSLDTDVAYKTLVESLKDTRTSAEIVYNDIGTYTGFETDDEPKVIDFVFTSSDVGGEDSPVKILSYDVFDTVMPEGYRLSDHRPVVVHFKVFRG